MKASFLFCMISWHLLGRDSIRSVGSMRIKFQENLSKSLNENLSKSLNENLSKNLSDVALGNVGYGNSSRRGRILQRASVDVTLAEDNDNVEEHDMISRSEQTVETKRRSRQADLYLNSRLLMGLVLGILIGIISVYVCVSVYERSSSSSLNQTEDSEISDGSPGQERILVPESDPDQANQSDAVAPKVRFANVADVQVTNEEKPCSADNIPGASDSTNDEKASETTDDERPAVIKFKSAPAKTKKYWFEPVLTSSDDESDDSDDELETLESAERKQRHKTVRKTRRFKTA